MIFSELQFLLGIIPRTSCHIRRYFRKDQERPHFTFQEGLESEYIPDHLQPLVLSCIHESFGSWRRNSEENGPDPQLRSEVHEPLSIAMAPTFELAYRNNNEYGLDHTVRPSDQTLGLEFPAMKVRSNFQKPISRFACPDKTWCGPLPSS